MRLCLFIAGLLSLVLSAKGGTTITALDCSIQEVRNAVAASAEGDTVIVPAGTCNWTTNLAITHGLILQGAGAGITVIVDEYVRANPPKALMTVTFANDVPFRMTGFTFKGGSVTANNFNGVFNFNTHSHSFRIDHNTITNIYGPNFIINGDCWGVIDHNNFYATQKEAMQVYHDAWNGKTLGHGSWADDPYWGQNKGLFVEDNLFQGPAATLLPGMIDHYQGARSIIRFNSFTNGGVTAHGTEGAIHGGKQIECYGNTLTTTSPGAFGQIRSGSGLIFSNTFVNFSSMWTLLQYREFRFGNATVGPSDGTSLYDTNNPAGILESGTHTGAAGALVLTDGTKAWTQGQWWGYSIRNTDRSRYSYITTNFATTITHQNGATDGQTNMVWYPGDHYAIRQVIESLDHPGMGKADLMSGNPPVPAAWPNQAVETLYSWQNLKSGVDMDILTAQGTQMAGKHYSNRVAKPGYTPFTYPHPLVSGTPVTQATLSVLSSSPGSGVTITVSPNDVNGNSDGSTAFSRTYTTNLVVTLTAPGSASGNAFSKWQRDGVDYFSGLTTNVLMDTGHSMTAVYTAAPAYLLTVSSSNPNSGVSLLVSPLDNNAAGDGVTGFTRTYNNSTVVSVTAPSVSGTGSHFSKWQLDGVDYSTSLSTTVTMGAAHTLQAFYLSPVQSTVAKRISRHRRWGL